MDHVEVPPELRLLLGIGTESPQTQDLSLSLRQYFAELQGFACFEEETDPPGPPPSALTSKALITAAKVKAEAKAKAKTETDPKLMPRARPTLKPMFPRGVGVDVEVEVDIGVLGKGWFSVVLGGRLAGYPVAVKIFKRGKGIYSKVDAYSLHKHAQREWNNLCRVAQQSTAFAFGNRVCLPLGIGVLADGVPYFILTQHGPTLESACIAKREDVRRFDLAPCFTTVIHTIQLLAGAGVVHGDIRSGNVLVGLDTDNSAVLCDFGSVVEAERGTDEYESACARDRVGVAKLWRKLVCVGPECEAVVDLPTESYEAMIEALKTTHSLE